MKACSFRVLGTRYYATRRPNLGGSNHSTSSVMKGDPRSGVLKGVPRHTSVPRNFRTVPREKVLGKCEHIKKGLCIKYLSSVTY